MNLVHTLAPEFSLPDQTGTIHNLRDYRGNYVLLYFYPKDDTPGCTLEACSFRDNLSDLKKNNIIVLGVSCDSVASHATFSKKFTLNFPLLADEDRSVVQAYGVWKEKSMFGKKYMGIVRDSFLIDPNGIIKKHYKKVKPTEHVNEIIHDIKKA
jgi:peroxiredoxin Q/BCP